MSKLQFSGRSSVRRDGEARVTRGAVQPMEALEGRQMMSASPAAVDDATAHLTSSALTVDLQHSAVLASHSDNSHSTKVEHHAQVKAEKAAARDADHAAREADQQAKKAGKSAAKDAKAAARAAKKAEKLQLRAERVQEREAQKAQRHVRSETPRSTPTGEPIVTPAPSAPEAAAVSPAVVTPAVVTPAVAAPTFVATPVAAAPSVAPAAAPTAVITPAPAPVVSNDSNNAAPSVTLVDNGVRSIAGPAQMVLRADASDTDGKVTRVDFYANNTFIGTAGGGPWMVSWTDVQPGTYQVTARAYDDDGAATTSSAMTYTVVQPSGGRTINVSPGQSVSDAVRSAKAGDTVLIQPGTYHDTITLRNSGTADKPITIKAAGAVGSVIIDGGTNDRLVADQWVGTGYWTTIQGITFRNAANAPGQNNAAIKTTNGMRLIDVRVENVDGGAIGVFGDNVVLLRVTAANNGCTGIGGSGVSNGMLVDCISTGNNTKHYSGSYEGGGGKFTRVKSLLVEGHSSYDNNGPGIWFDGENINVTIRGSVFHDNHDLWRSDGSQSIGGRGIQLEISGIDTDGQGGIDREGPILIENCLTYDNDNASVQVYATSNVTIQNNTFVNDYIDLKDKRPAPFLVRNLTITNNTLQDAHIEADKEVVNNYQSEHLIIDNNTYTGGGKVFRWNYKDQSLSAVRALGFEAHGKTAAA